MSTLPFQYDDGGRSAAGFKGTTGDCVTRAIAIAAGTPYRDVYDKVNELGAKERKSKLRRGKSGARTGIYRPTIQRYLKSLGWTWHPTMQIGSGCKVHLAAGELPEDQMLIVSVSKHLTVVDRGVIRDNHDPSRDGTRCVYGYWAKPSVKV